MPFKPAKSNHRYSIEGWRQVAEEVAGRQDIDLASHHTYVASGASSFLRLFRSPTSVVTGVDFKQELTDCNGYTERPKFHSQFFSRLSSASGRRKICRLTQGGRRGLLDKKQ